MKFILPLLNLEKTLGPGWLRPLALMPLADSNVLGQIAYSALRVAGIATLFPGKAGEGEVADWFRATYPEVEAQFVAVQQARDPLHAVWLTRSLWRDDEVLLALGDAIIDADLNHLSGQGETTVLIGEETSPHSTPGILWLQDGELLVNALRPLYAAGSNETPPALSALLRQLQPDLKVGQMRPNLALSLVTPGTGEITPEHLLAANNRLLGFGRAPAGAIERSYSDEFTVLPPVSIDDEAIINSSVIGPQTSIAAGAFVERSIISRSIICPGARIENAVLDGALVGDGAQVRGTMCSAAVADGEVVIVGGTPR